MQKLLAGIVMLNQLGGGVAAAAPLTELERQHLVAHLEMTGAWFVDEVTGITPAQLAFRPAPAAWTILEVIDHLVVVGPIYWQDLQNALKTPAGRKSRMTDADILWYGIDRTNRETAISSESPPGRLRDLQAGLDAYREQHAQLLQFARTTQDDLRNWRTAQAR